MNSRMLVFGRFRATYGMDYFRMADGPEVVQASSISQEVGSLDHASTQNWHSTRPSRRSPDVRRQAI